MNKKVLIGAIVTGVLVVGGAMFFGGKDDSKVVENKETIVVTDRKGQVTVPKDPEKVVVLDYSALDTMEVLGEEAIAVPKANLPDYLSEYKDSKYEDLGSLKKFDIEKINELSPDLIIIEGRQEDFYDELSKIAPTIMLGREGNDHFGSLDRSVKVLGQIFDKEDIINTKRENINQSLKNISQTVKAGNLNALVTMLDNGQISAFGNDSRFGLIYNDFGFKNIDENLDSSSHGSTVNSEYILSKNPEYLFVIDKANVNDTAASNKDIIENELIKKTDAFKNNKIIYLDTKAWYVGGPGLQSTKIMIDEIENIINTK